MKRIVLKTVAGLLMTLMCVTAGARTMDEGNINIIPMPQQMVLRKGSFRLTDGMTIGAQTPEAKKVARYFADKMQRSTGLRMKVAARGKIMLRLQSKAAANPESYQLSVTGNRVEATAPTVQGLFYAMQSFMQLLPAEIESTKLVKGVEWTAPAVEIKDEPRFGYRGFHADPCRHWMTVDEVKRQLDVLAMFKINTMHWHLTDDQGWRVEIKKYPKLTTIGATRVDGEGTTYGPYFYTQDEIRDIVQYAADRCITVIPELEIPGHELAAISAYPELSCEGNPTTPRAIWGVEDVVMCPGKEEVFSFLEDVIDEMVALFPATYFHIGGDECPKTSWEKCPLCQKRIKDEGLVGDDKHSAEQLLQTYVVHRVEKYLAKYGKKIIGWDEILEGKPARTATIMSWRGEEGGIEAALAGHDAIMTPGSKGLYLDFYQGDSKTEPVAIGGYAPLSMTYNYEPLPDTLVALGKQQHIIGVQSNSWSEYFYRNAIREYHMYPRSIAVAEVGWTKKENKSFDDFERRLNKAYVRLDGHGVNYHIPLPEQPGGSSDQVAFVDKAELTFTTSRPMKMVYTTDGTDPTPASTVYTQPIVFTHSGVLKIASVLPTGKMSRIRTISVEKQALSPSVDSEKVEAGWNMEVYYGMYLDRKFFDRATEGTAPHARKVIKELSELTSFVKSTTSMRNFKQYAALAHGYIQIPEDGVYYLSSELEQVKVDGRLVVDNGGEVKRHTHRDGSVALSKGLHRVEALFLGHIIGGWPSNWNDGAIRIRKSTEPEFKSVTPDMMWH